MSLLEASQYNKDDLEVPSQPVCHKIYHDKRQKPRDNVRLSKAITNIKTRRRQTNSQERRGLEGRGLTPERTFLFPSVLLKAVCPNLLSYSNKAVSWIVVPIKELHKLVARRVTAPSKKNSLHSRFGKRTKQPRSFMHGAGCPVRATPSISLPSPSPPGGSSETT